MLKSKVISSDSHVMEPSDLWKTRVEKQYRERAPHVVSQSDGDWWYFEGKPAVPCKVTADAGGRWTGAGTKQVAKATDTRPGGHDPAERLKDLDLDGVYGDFVYPTVGMYAFRWLPDSELVDAMCRAYNDWVGEFCSVYPHRIKGSAMINVDNVEEAVREVQRAANKGLVAALISVYPGEDRSYDKPMYDPFWAALQDVDMAIGFHLLTNRERKTLRVGQFDTFGGPSATCTQPYWIERTIADMLLAGVFERFPKLKVISVEYEASWAAPLMQLMDQKYKMYVHGFKKKAWPVFKDGALPSDHFKRNVFLSFQEDSLAVPIRSYIGIDNLMWGSDYPHTSGTFPKSREIIEGLVKGIPETEQEKIVYGNAARVLRFN